MFCGAAEAAAIPFCYASCGLIEDFSPFTKRRTSTAAEVGSQSSSPIRKMKRASASRRSLVIQSPPPRSRSSERASAERWGGDRSRGRGVFDDNNDDDVDNEDAVVKRMNTVDDDDSEDSVPMPQHRQHKSRGHVRAMSDPFDTQKDATDRRDDDDDAIFQQLQQQGGEPLFTMPRFPCVASRSKNCWSEPPISLFHVRGPSYFSNKKKVPSAPYLLQARGCDLFVHNESESNSSSPIDLEERYDLKKLLLHLICLC